MSEPPPRTNVVTRAPLDADPNGGARVGLSEHDCLCGHGPELHRYASPHRWWASHGGVRCFGAAALCPCSQYRPRQLTIPGSE